MNRRNTLKWMAALACGLVVGELALTPAADAAAPNADAIVGAVDKNLTYPSRFAKATMNVVKPGGREKVYEFQTWGRGYTEAATEFVSPERDAGTKMLKKGNEMWTWLPSVEKTQKLSGHMLRNPLMGSSISYEDLLEAASWKDSYTSVLAGSDAVDGRQVWVLDMTAKSGDVAYPKRKVWVDQEWHLPVKQELYALSGTLLKTWIMKDPKDFGGRWYPQTMVVSDEVQKGSITTLTFREMQFGVDVDPEVFDLRWLER